MNQTISKVKSKYWTCTHKYGVNIPKSVKDLVVIEKSNVNVLWWEEIIQKMKTMSTYFELYEGNVEDLPTWY